MKTKPKNSVKCCRTFKNSLHPPTLSTLRTHYARPLDCTPLSFISSWAPFFWTWNQRLWTGIQIKVEPWHGTGSRLSELGPCSSELASLSLKGQRPKRWILQTIWFILSQHKHHYGWQRPFGGATLKQRVQLFKNAVFWCTYFALDLAFMGRILFCP